MSRAPVRYVRGDWKAVCDVCGRFYLASELKKRWDGVMVCSVDYELRHPQDFVRAKQDIQAPPWTRPQNADIFVNTNLSGPQTIDGASIDSPLIG